MTALSDLQKKLEKESQGIMFPFSAKTPTVDTTQQVYNSATDGIMNMQGKKYVGPDSVIQYGSEEEGFARQLKQIEAPMLPQFDATQFPKAGEGIVETPVTVTPPTTEPVQPIQPDQPAFDPCPVGFKFDPQLQRCVPVERQRSDRQTGPTNPPRNIGPTANAVSQISNSLEKLKDEGGLYKDGFKETVTLQIDNSTFLSKLGPFGKLIDSFLIQGPANKNFVDTFGKQNYPDDITVIENKDGTITATFNQKGKQIADELMTKESLSGNLASTQKTKNGNIIIAPNGQPEIVGPIKVGSFGTTDPSAGFKSSPSYKIKEGKVVYDKPSKKAPTPTYKAPKKGTGSSGPPGTTPKSNKITRAKNLTNRAAPKQVAIKSEKFSGKGFTRGR